MNLAPGRLRRYADALGRSNADSYLYTIHSGKVGNGFQFASGQAVGRAENPSAFSDATLKLQDPLFREAGFDMTHEIPGLFWGTVNVELPYELVLNEADVTLRDVDWTANEQTRIAPEDFSFVRCCLAYDGRFYPGYLYYPHPETKPTSVNGHNYAVLEALVPQVAGLVCGQPAAIVCRADAFRPRHG